MRRDIGPRAGRHEACGRSSTIQTRVQLRQRATSSSIISKSCAWQVGQRTTRGVSSPIVIPVLAFTRSRQGSSHPATNLPAMKTAVSITARLGAAALLATGLAACGSDSTSSSTPTGGTDTSGLLSSAASVVKGCTTTPPTDTPARKEYSSPPPMSINASTTYTAVLKTSCGTIRIRLDARLAPKTVNNFVFLARERFYDGLTFHRTSPGFVIQGGDPSGDGSGGPGYSFADELPTDGYPLGSVAMANSGPDTNGSQFFIVTGDAGFLKNDYSKFGKVVAGLDVARRIESLAPPDAQPGDMNAETPRQAAYIYSVTIAEG